MSFRIGVEFSDHLSSLAKKERKRLGDTAKKRKARKVARDSRRRNHR